MIRKASRGAAIRELRVLVSGVKSASASKEKDCIHYIAINIDGEVKDEEEREKERENDKVLDIQLSIIIITTYIA